MRRRTACNCLSLWMQSATKLSTHYQRNTSIQDGDPIHAAWTTLAFAFFARTTSRILAPAFRAAMLAASRVSRRFVIRRQRAASSYSPNYTMCSTLPWHSVRSSPGCCQIIWDFPLAPEVANSQSSYTLAIIHKVEERILCAIVGFGDQ